jgi:PAB-dependent poly(A)-specific ribonuclease subunit 3
MPLCSTSTLLNKPLTFSSYNDVLEEELSKELENSRIARLLAKLGFINERPEYVPPVFHAF